MSRCGPGASFLQAAALLAILGLIAVMRRFEGPAEAPLPSPLPGAPQITMTFGIGARCAEIVTSPVAASVVPKADTANCGRPQSSEPGFVRYMRAAAAARRGAHRQNPPP